MNPLLQQFLAEAREALQCIAERLMQLEQEPENSDLLTDLFRSVHTLKGNSGLFDFPELTRVLHAGEDLLDALQEGRVGFSRQLADLLLDVMDFVGMLCDEIEQGGGIQATHAEESAGLAEKLRTSITMSSTLQEPDRTEAVSSEAETNPDDTDTALLAAVPEPVRMAAYRSAAQGAPLHLILYRPVEECFFQGDDPFYQARQTPGFLWGDIRARKLWPALAELDAYHCNLDFHILTAALPEDLNEQFRYVLDQTLMTSVSPLSLILPAGDLNGGPVYDDFVDDVLKLLNAGNMKGVIRSVRSMLELSNPELWLSSALRWLLLVTEVEPENQAVITAIVTSLRSLTPPQWNTAEPESHPQRQVDAVVPDPADGAVRIPLDLDDEAAAILAVQHEILSLPDDVPWIAGRVRGVSASLRGCLGSRGFHSLTGLAEATEAAAAGAAAGPLLAWLDNLTAPADAESDRSTPDPAPEKTTVPEPGIPLLPAVEPPPLRAVEPVPLPAAEPVPQPESEPKFSRRGEETFSAVKSIKVDQARIDRLMNLIGEMVVAKNALPYLAGRAESVYGVRELAREIKAEYAVINRIAEELQDSIMQVRMMPVSFVFQRFPRLVRDTANKLGKKVNLILEGEETEADKNMIEALGDPLVHIVRNSLDHGIEPPEQRLAAGKPATGSLIIRATQEADRVVIEVRDDGKGIDPELVKRKACEKGLISEEQVERMTEQEALNLVFLPGFSTVAAVSDLSGRGVGMDVVRTAIERVNGTLRLESARGKGTRIRISLPLTMAVTNVMIVESNGQIFGVPMDMVRETVRVPRSAVRMIKKNMTTVLRGRIVPLKPLNPLLELAAPQKTNSDDEFAVLVVGMGSEAVGILVDDFHETVDIILKPMTGILSGISAYAGSALLGDGSVLMVLNIREVL